MSKVAFRARNLDANRALPVLRDHELPPEFMENGTSAPRITQQEITTGMEKEEEMVSLVSESGPSWPYLL